MFDTISSFHSKLLMNSFNMVRLKIRMFIH